MKTVKVSKYSRLLPGIRARLNALRLEQALVYQSSRNHCSLSEAILELVQLEQRIETADVELRTTELLHEAALLIGDYEEFPTLDVV